MGVGSLAVDTQMAPQRKRQRRGGQQHSLGQRQREGAREEAP